MGSNHKGNNTHSIRSMAVDEERMRPGHLLWSVLCVPFSALILMAGYRESQLAHKNRLLLIPTASLLEQVTGGPDVDTVDFLKNDH